MTTLPAALACTKTGSGFHDWAIWVGLGVGVRAGGLGAWADCEAVGTAELEASGVDEGADERSGVDETSPIAAGVEGPAVGPPEPSDPRATCQRRAPDSNAHRASAAVRRGQGRVRGSISVGGSAHQKTPT